MTPSPDFERLRTAFFRRGVPDRVPLVEVGVDSVHKTAILGRPVRSFEDEVEFWYKAGYDFVPVQVGLRTLLRPDRESFFTTGDTPLHPAAEALAGTRRVHTADYGIGAAASRSREWAPEHGEGVIRSIEDCERFPWPAAGEMDFSPIEQVERVLPKGMRVIAVLGYIYTPVWWMMGFESFCLALIEQPDLIARLFERVGAIQLGVVERLTAYPVVGAIWNPDDIAYTEALIVPPRVLRQHLFPWYRRMAELAHARDTAFCFHSDGRLWAVMDDIVAAGFDALNPIEPKAMDIVDVKRRYGDKLCITGNIDLIHTLPFGTEEEVENEVRQRIRDIGPDGGYCVASANSIPEYVPTRNFNAMREATFKWGAYPLQA